MVLTADRKSLCSASTWPYRLSSRPSRSLRSVVTARCLRLRVRCSPSHTHPKVGADQGLRAKDAVRPLLGGLGHTLGGGIKSIFRCTEGFPFCPCTEIALRFDERPGAHSAHETSLPGSTGGFLSCSRSKGAPRVPSKAGCARGGCENPIMRCA